MNEKALNSSLLNKVKVDLKDVVSAYFNSMKIVKHSVSK